MIRPGFEGLSPDQRSAEHPPCSNVLGPRVRSKDHAVDLLCGYQSILCTICRSAPLHLCSHHPHWKREEAAGPHVALRAGRVVKIRLECPGVAMDGVIELEKHMTVQSRCGMRITQVKEHRKPLVALRIASIPLVARHPDVYEPCDDSFALVDALLAEKVKLLEQRPSLCLEVGCGSGYVITSLALILGKDVNAQFLATDISRTAAQVTRETLSAHDIEADVVVTDLVRGLEKRLAGAVDVLLFNPPYVPTPDHEVGVAGITASWAGGERGRVVIDRMLTMVDNLLSNKGWFYMVTLTANNPSEICQSMKRKGFASRIVIQRYTEEENLHILKFWRGTCL